MRPEQAKLLLPLVQAIADGKTIQFKYPTGWENIDAPRFTDPLDLYRVKPEPESVPWSAEDVPPVCWMRGKDDDNSWVLITRISSTGVGAEILGVVSWPLLRKNFMYSTDLKIWLPCEKAVEE